MAQYPPRQPRMHSYVLRVWQEAAVEATVQSSHWRVSLTRIPTGERIGFSDLTAALAFIQKELAQPKA